MDKFEDMVLLMERAAVEAHKFYSKGNKTAGVRLRAMMQTMKALAQEVRKDVVSDRP